MSAATAQGEEERGTSPRERGAWTPARVGAVAGIVAALAVGALAAVIVRAYPFVHMESAAYLANALDGRPFLTQVFDVQRNDFGLYQARELSYAADGIDARFVAWVFRGTGFFLPVSLLQILMVGVVVGTSVTWLRARTPALGAAVWVPALLFATSASTLLGARHFRTAKSLAAIALVALAWQLVQLLSAPRVPRALSLLVVTCTASVLVLADRQGTFFVIALIGSAWVSAPRTSRAPLLLALLLAVLGGTLYNLWVGPWLIRHFAHQEVNWSLQSGVIELAPLVQWSTWRGAFSWLLESLSVLAGALGVGWGAAVALGGMVLARYAGGRAWLARALGAFVMLLGLAALMKTRHPALDAPDVRITYYNLPLLALCTVALALALERLARRDDWARWRPRAVLAGVLLGALNLAALPRLAGRVRDGADARYVPVSVALQRCIEASEAHSFDRIPRDVAWLSRYPRLCERYRALR